MLDGAKEGAAVYNSATMTLDEVINIMEQTARDGKIIVRPHTGDPCLYGATREQMDRLDDLLPSPNRVCPWGDGYKPVCLDYL